MAKDDKSFSFLTPAHIHCLFQMDGSVVELGQRAGQTTLNSSPWPVFEERRFETEVCCGGSTRQLTVQIGRLCHDGR